MLRKIYFILRILAYLLCGTGLVLFLSKRHLPDSPEVKAAALLLGIGFTLFFATYVIWFFIRFQRRD